MKGLALFLLLGLTTSANASETHTFSNGCKVTCLQGTWLTPRFPAPYPIQCSAGPAGPVVCPRGPASQQVIPPGALIDPDGRWRF